MKAKEGITNLLNKLLTANLTAINQYFVHAKMCENWGYERLYHKVRERSFDEMKDADHLIDHILYLGRRSEYATFGYRASGRDGSRTVLYRFEI